MTVAAILKHKGNQVTTVDPTVTIAEVTEILARHRIGAVIVMDHAQHLRGVVSERDIVRSLAANGARTLEMTAAQLMTREVQVATPDITVGQAMNVMTEGRFRHLPVVDNDRLIGLISIGDVVKARITQQAHEVDSLRAYVAGAAQRHSRLSAGRRDETPAAYESRRAGTEPKFHLPRVGGALLGADDCHGAGAWGDTCFGGTLRHRSRRRLDSRPVKQVHHSKRLTSA